ncbi:calcium/sodium antiporter [Hoyosella sp. YIM 151337]|uniref:calcium/sodium antiporter n=1 Tax=Hoyosella sp. YIM 151337 TaxID=2992742 RepID=UPI002235AC11|nr:calcium/sodium antiporter [Hoyosella sp. YIM 151337]MCW4352848.1 calcium/sodium antiporter [Hoyosella sp. YIM 151337]
MSALTIAVLVAGFVLLILGGETLVRGASSLARIFGMSPLIVGLTVVAFATSTPELAVSAGAALSGYPGIAVGNVVGSNIANILLIVGLTALLAPLIVKSRIVRADIPVMAAFSVVLLVIALDGTVSRLDGAILLVALVAYLTVTVVTSRRSRAPVSGPESPAANAPGESAGATSRTRSLLVSSGLVALGVLLLVVGARLLVSAASEIASALGVSDLIVGLTVVAIGTSLPELATSLIAAARGERDMAVGNIVGSNVFNIGAVLGVTSLITPIEVAPSAVRFDLPIMVAVALVLLPVAFTAMAISRWEGALFAGFYVAYIGYLVLQAAGHDALEPYSAAMLWFVIPISALWLVLLATYELGVRRGRRQAFRHKHARSRPS